MFWLLNHSAGGKKLMMLVIDVSAPMLDRVSQIILSMVVLLRLLYNFYYLYC